MAPQGLFGLELETVSKYSMCKTIWGTSSIHCDAFSYISVIFNDRALHDCGLSYTLPLRDGVCCGSYDGLQGAGNRDCCAVATKGVCKRNPCWPGWRPAAGCGQCVYACHRVLESGGALWHRQTLQILKYRLWHFIGVNEQWFFTLYLSICDDWNKFYRAVLC